MDPLIGEIRLMAISFNPVGWLPCDGRLMAINQSTALFSLLGTTYGGDGRTTFALPDLRGRTAIGRSPSYPLGIQTGTEASVLTINQLPVHTHTLSATVPVSTAAGTTGSPGGAFFASVGSQYGDSADGANMAAGVLSGDSASAGGGQPHENRMPFLVMNYFIATSGIYPQRT